MRRLQHYGILLLVSVVVGCAQVGVPPPQSAEQTIAYLYPANAQIREEAAKALQNKQISKAEAQTVLDMTDKSRSAIDLARDFAKARNQPKVEAAISLAKGVMREARKYLNLPEEPRLR